MVFVVGEEVLTSVAAVHETRIPAFVYYLALALTCCYGCFMTVHIIAIVYG